MKSQKTFECLRCDHRYPVDYDPKEEYLARQDEVKDGVFSGP